MKTLLLIVSFLQISDFVVTERFDKRVSANACKCVTCTCKDCKCVVDACSCVGCKTTVELDLGGLPEFVKPEPYVIDVYSPTWCIACPAFHNKYGNGNDVVRLNYIKKEAPFTVLSYPCLHDSKQGLQMQGGYSRDIDHIIQAFHIKAKVSKPQAVKVEASLSGDQKIPWDKIDTVRKMIPNLTLVLENKEKIALPVKGMDVTLLPMTTIYLKTQANGDLKVTSEPKPEAKYGMTVNIDSLTLDKDKQLIVELPGWVPDLTIDLSKK